MRSEKRSLSGLYIISSQTNLTDETAKSDGVAKKILSHIQVLCKSGIDMKLVNVGRKTSNSLIKLFDSLFCKMLYVNAIRGYQNIDVVYIRSVPPINASWLFLLQYLKKMGAIIIYEFPTYPYLGEYSGIKRFVVSFVDNLFKNKLKKYVDYVATYSNHEQIFGVKTIKIMNGINCSDIEPIRNIEYHTCVRLCCVAQFAQWHGYDRLIEGLYEYYKNNPKKKIFIDFVGDGSVLSQYQEMVNKYGVIQYVVFHGVLTGAALSAVFNQADIAVCSLGCHRIGVFLGSFLKSREYIARGLPMISSTKIDILPDDYPYIQYVPEDDTPIDMMTILGFYEKLYRKETRDIQIKNIRRFAEEHCDMKVVMEPVIDAINKYFER